MVKAPQVAGLPQRWRSYTVAALTTIYDEAGLQVILAAPTGKAAKRLEEVSHRQASTIHRLLGFDGKSFARGSEDPIDADVVIVDEVSMVDIPLAWQLFQTIDPERTAVVLVGDHNQLPPVGPRRQRSSSGTAGASPTAPANATSMSVGDRVDTRSPCMARRCGAPSASGLTRHGEPTGNAERRAAPRLDAVRKAGTIWPVCQRVLGTRERSL